MSYIRCSWFSVLFISLAISAMWEATERLFTSTTKWAYFYANTISLFISNWRGIRFMPIIFLFIFARWLLFIGSFLCTVATIYKARDSVQLIEFAVLFVCHKNVYIYNRMTKLLKCFFLIIPNFEKKEALFDNVLIYEAN